MRKLISAAALLTLAACGGSSSPQAYCEVTSVVDAGNVRYDAAAGCTALCDDVVFPSHDLGGASAIQASCSGGDADLGTTNVSCVYRVCQPPAAR